MKIIGLTGGIATGKSTVSRMFLEYGVPVIDSDKIAREVVGVGQPLLLKLEHEFGKEIIRDDGSLNRIKLGEIVFRDKMKLERLNNLTHPVIRARIFNEVEIYKRDSHKLCVIDVPLLIESKFNDFVDIILLVYVDKSTQLKRLILREKYPEEEALRRINAQMDIEEKKECADYVIDNSLGIDYTRKQLLQFLDTVLIGEGPNG